MRTLIFTALAATTLAGCANKADHDELAARVAALEKRVDSVESRPSTGSAGPSAADEGKAQALYEEVNKLMAAGDYDGAKAKVATLVKDYGSTKTGQRAARTKRELDVIGQSVTTPDTEQWYVGSKDDLNLESGSTLVVFWEIWCPHCRREVPELNATAKKFDGKMDVVGLTKLTKSATEEKVTEFIKEQEVTYAMAKETGEASKTFAVSGIPAAAFVKDGKVLWRGHPGRLTDEMLEKMIGS